MSLIDDAVKVGGFNHCPEEGNHDRGVELTESELAALKALWLSGGQEPVGFIRSDYKAVMDVYRGANLLPKSEGIYNIPLYTTSPNVAEIKAQAQVELIREMQNMSWADVVKFAEELERKGEL